MPLQKQLLDVPLSLGLDQKTDVRGLLSGGAAIMSKCVKLKNGAIRKRFGTTALSNAATNFGIIAAAAGGGSHKNAQWMTDGQNIYSWSDQNGVWQNQDNVPEAVALDRLQVAAFAQTILEYDMATGNGMLVAVFLAPAPASATLVVWSTVLDVSSLGSSTGIGGLQQGLTGAIVAPLNVVDPALAAAVAPRVVVCGTHAILTCVRGTTLFCRNLDLTNPTAGWSAESTLATGLSANSQAGVYDLSAINGDPTRFAVVYATTFPNTILNILNSTTLASGGTLIVFATDAFLLGLCAENNGLYGVIKSDGVGAGVTYMVGGYDEGSATILTPAAVEATGDSVHKGWVAIEQAGTNALGWIVSTGVAFGTTAMQTSYVSYGRATVAAGVVTSSGNNRTQPGVQLASKPIVNAATGVAYFAVQTPSALQGTTYVAATLFWTDGTTSAQPGEAAVLALRPIVTLAPRLLKNVPARNSGHGFVCPHFPLLGIPNAGSFGVFALPVAYSTETFHAAVIAQPIDFASPIAFRSSELGDSTCITTGTPALYDGQVTCESGYCAYPEISTAMNGGGGNLSAGSYQWCAVFEWYDTRGQIHRSAPSPVSTNTAMANDESFVTISTPGLTMRTRLSPAAALNTLPLTTHVYAILYRTTVNGTLFYRQTADPPPAANALVNGTQNLVITDALSDANLTAAATAQLLYTTGGVLPNLNPPSARCIVQHTQRFVLAGCDNPRQVWASKALTDGESPGFNEQLAFEATGAVRAVQSMDGNLILFVQRGASYGIEYVSGQGPTDEGTQNDWTPPTPIPAAVGAVDQRGTCVGPFGILFRSPVGGPNGTGGLFVLSRDLQVTYVGAAVEDSLAACPIVTSMVVHPNAGRVYITTIQNDSNPVTTGGATRLVWDYLENCWSTDTLWDADAGATGLGVRAAWIAQAGGMQGAPQGPAYHCASPSGREYRETFGQGAGAYLDAGSQWITMRYRGSLWKPSLGGFARMWRLQMQADSLEAHDYTVTLTFDGAPAAYYSESVTWTALQAAQFDRFPQLDTEMLIDNQKARSVQVEIFDATPAGGGVVTGQGASWAGLSLELGVKEGLYRNIPAGQRA